MKRVTFEVTLEVEDSVQVTETTETLSALLSIGTVILTDVDYIGTKPNHPTFSEGPISWQAASKIAADYEMVLAREEKDGHQLYVDKHDTIRWVENPIREKEIMDIYRAGDLSQLFMHGADKNTAIIRELYKCIGYSLCGFWEIFYWEVNNERANEYVAPITTLEK